jgi:hypothetical protein
MAERYAIQKGDSFIVNLQMLGNVNHSHQNPVWEIPGLCYLAAINIAIPSNKFWPMNPTVQQMSRFGYKYQKLQPFQLVETIPGEHCTLVMGKPTQYRDNSGWRYVDYLARNSNLMRVGGDGDKTDVKTLDGTNYQQWAPKMKAYLMSKELWYYVNGETKCPLCIDAPIQPVPESGSTTVAASATAAYEAALKTYNEQRDVQIVWDRADNKALGIIQLRMADKLQYLVKDTSLESWANIKSQFDVSGPAAIFVDFKYVINFKFDERKEPAIQFAEINTQLNRLATHGFNLDHRIQAMIILSGLPQSWDSVQGSILANHDMGELDISVIMPILQEEWQRRQARRGDHKSSHLARGECMEPLNANIGKETRITLVILHRQVHQIITPVINLLHTKNLVKSRITSLITKILVITRTTLAVKVQMVPIGNETARITRTRNRQECYLKNK